MNKPAYKLKPMARRFFLKACTAPSIGALLQACGGGGSGGGGNSTDTPSTLIATVQTKPIRLNQLARDPVNQVIVLENSYPGTNDWQLSRPPSVLAWSNSNSPFPSGDIDRSTQRCHIIEGYAWPHSVNIGEGISFYVSTTSRSFSLNIFRMGWYQGFGGRLMPNCTWSDIVTGGRDDPQPAPAIPLSTQRASDHNDWGDASHWKPANLDGTGLQSLKIPQNWVSGCYLAKLEESSTGIQSYIFFVVRDDLRPSDLILQIPYATYQAYNGWGGKSNYGYNNLGTLRGENWFNGNDPSGLIWFKRPFLPSNSPAGNRGAGAGAFLTIDKGISGNLTWPSGNNVNAGGGSCSGVDYNMVRWLEREGYDVTYCTSLDTHQGQLFRAAHNIFISVGHDEYYSLQQYANLEKARDETGISLLWYAGNTVWRGMSFDILNGCMSGISPKTGNPINNGKGISSYALSGAGWTFGGTPGNQDDYLISYQCPEWLFNSTSLTQGSRAGNSLIGYEGDGLSEKYKSCYLPGLKIFMANKSNTVHAVSYTARSSGAFVMSLASIQFSWGLDDFTVESGEAGRGLRESNDIKQVARNIIEFCLSRKNMLSDLSDGIFTISPADQEKLTLNCSPTGSLLLSTGLTSSQEHYWKINKYSPTQTQKLAAIGPLKAASNVWFTISNGEYYLSSGDRNLQNDSITATTSTIGLGRFWRIWRNKSYTTISNNSVYTIQNVGSGQTMVFQNDHSDAILPSGSPDIGWISAIEATIDGWSVTTPIKCIRSGLFAQDQGYWLHGSDGNFIKAVQLKIFIIDNRIVVKVIGSRFTQNSFVISDADSFFADPNLSQASAVAASKTESGYGLRDVTIKLINGTIFSIRGINGNYIDSSSGSNVNLSTLPCAEQRGDYNMGYGEVDYSIEKYWVITPVK